MIEALDQIQSYCNNLKPIQDYVLTYLNDSDTANDQDNLNKIFQEIENQNISKNEILFDEFLRMLSSIASYHLYSNNFYKKIIRLINEYKNVIKNNYTNEEIFSIFLHNEPIIIFLSKEEIFNFEDNDFKNLINNNDYKEQYDYFFSTELDEQERGKNHTQLCKIIRSDQKDDFFAFIEQNNILLNSNIQPSMFETNHFLREQKEVSLLQYSAIYGSVEIFRSIIEKEPDLLTGEIWPFAFLGGNSYVIEIVEALSTPPPKDNFKSCLLILIQRHQNELFNQIKSNYTPEKETTEEGELDIKDEDDEYIVNPLIKTAIHSFNFSIISQLIKDVKSDEEINEILHEASKVGFSKIVELVMNLPSININKCEKTTALQKACNNGNYFVVNILIAHPNIDLNLQSLPNIEANDVNYDGLTALSRAVRYGHNKVVDLLLKQEKIDVNRNSRWYGTAPIHAAAIFNNVKAMELLLKCNGINVNIQTNDHYKMISQLTLVDGRETALHLACLYNHAEIVKLLLAAPGIDKTLKNWDEKTPIEYTDNQEIKSLFN